VDNVEMWVQIESDGSQVPHSGEARNGQQRVNSAKNPAKPPHSVRAFSKSRPESEHTASEMKKIVSWRKSKIKHLVPKETGNANHDQNRPA
jgi:hypothetical protein